MDAIAGRIVAMGKGTLIAKMDNKQAYQMVPVYPADRRLLGMKWEGKFYVDNCLPFDLRSAPLIFSAIADALAWIMRGRGASFTEHYIDDFITLGRPSSEECKVNQRLILETCEVMGAPIEDEKSEGPSTSLVFLGIELNSVTIEMRLPADKPQHLKEVLILWRRKKAGRKRDILLLIGSLPNVCKVVEPGCAFLRRIIELTKQAKEPSHFVRLKKKPGPISNGGTSSQGCQILRAATINTLGCWESLAYLLYVPMDRHVWVWHVKSGHTWTTEHVQYRLLGV